MEAKKIQPKGVTLTSDDIREVIVGVLSIYIQDPQNYTLALGLQNLQSQQGGTPWPMVTAVLATQAP